MLVHYTVGRGGFVDALHRYGDGTEHGLCWGFEVTGYGRLLYMGGLSCVYFSVRTC